MNFNQWRKSLSLPPRGSKRWWVAGAIALVAVVGGVQGIRAVLPAQKSLDLDRLTVAAQTESLTLRIKASGTVTPRETVNVSPKSAGRVMELLVEQGDYIQKGQVIARMDASDLERERQQALANVEAARARLAQLQEPARPELVGQAKADVLRSQGEIARSEGQVADAQSQLDFAKRQRERQEALAKEGAISRDSLDEFVRREQSARESLRQAQAQLDQAKAQLTGNQERLTQQGQTGSQSDIAIQEAQLAAAIAQLKAVENRLADTVIRAPFAGLVTQRYASVGAFVTPTTQASASGTGATSTSIVALASDLEVVAKVPEIDIAQIKPGQLAEITADAFPKEVFQGKVRLIAPEAIEDRDVKFFQVRISLLNGQKRLKSGMNADLEFIGSQSTSLIVPTVAIVTKQGQTGVLVPGKDSKPEFRRVTIGVSQENRSANGQPEGQTQVLDGLQAGDRVFVQLPEGQKLDQIIKESSSP